MIREFTWSDLEAVCRIYAHYVEESTASFELVAPDSKEMGRRLGEVSALGLPIVVECGDGGDVRGYAYVHPWKERPCYGRVLEVTVYVAVQALGLGLGRQLAQEVVERTRALGRYDALIACITGENSASRRMFASLDFGQVSFFPGVGRKFGRLLDVADYQLALTSSPCRPCRD